MPVRSLRESLRLMGQQDYANGLPRSAIPGDLDGDELAWVEGWDAAAADQMPAASMEAEFSS
ncbi:hypothetical protein [Acidisphaera sp. L21]|uniref:hypothetical protein n=1 Tax=Acidisphaera sp. L21 TaxID=1641851 RepID=UPI00131C563A|nr:hypothetical protein [Acidisphaera sp. L21]